MGGKVGLGTAISLRYFPQRFIRGVQGQTELMNGKKRFAGAAEAFAAGCFALGLTLVAAAGPASSFELTEPQAALYSTVSIFPPDASRMTVCYGFVCRRREIVDFTASDRAALIRVNHY